jgi:hypothetical protein
MDSISGCRCGTAARRRAGANALGIGIFSQVWQ